ncbi:response regulator transcription factor [Alkalilimnicola ehrlichii]|uniref:response regulator transcription factor n=1 Tax=Alkalilimnicola ehrlichii TaxID=351052 RepID=UPI003BA33F03
MESHSVLVVDDEPNIVLSLRFLMQAEGYPVHVACDGCQALELARVHRPRVILLDLMLPGEDGYEVCQRLREVPGGRDAGIIMLTARGRQTEREKGLALGADDYVTKPFSTRDLLRRVAHYMQAGRDTPLASAPTPIAGSM